MRDWQRLCILSGFVGLILLGSTAAQAQNVSAAGPGSEPATLAPRQGTVKPPLSAASLAVRVRLRVDGMAVELTDDALPDPGVLATLLLPQSAREFQLVGRVVFLINQESGVSVLDLTEPGTPKHALLEAGLPVSRMSLQSERTLILQLSSGERALYDVTDPRHAVLFGRIPASAQQRSS